MSASGTPSRPVAGALLETWLERRDTPLLESLFAVKVSTLQDAWTWEFDGLNPGLELCLREHLNETWSIELFVRARLQGRVWGLLYYSRLDPVQVGERWESLARGEFDPSVMRLEPMPHPHALIERELFAPFALWVDEGLTEAEWLLFFGSVLGSLVALSSDSVLITRDDLVDAVPLRGALGRNPPYLTLATHLARQRLKLKVTRGSDSAAS